MNPIVLYALLVAVIFGLIALIDLGLKKLFPKCGTHTAGQAVRLPRYSMILGLILALVGLMALLWIPLEGETMLAIGCVVALALGLYLLVNFWRFGIFYDEEGFSYRTLTKKEKHYSYADITAQRSFLAKSGLNTTLYAAGDEIPLYAAMQGLPDFLNKAFYRWCDATGTDPDSVENNPSMLTFFPAPADTTE